LHHETTLLPYKLATFHFGNRGSPVSRKFLEKRSITQIEALGRMRVNDFFWESSKWEIKTGAGAY
jgi:hypothetical protein